jgi:hypothetical protein
MPKLSPKIPHESELRLDGWSRFVEAVHAAAKNGPMHRTSKPNRTKKVTRKPKKSGTVSF